MSWNLVSHIHFVAYGGQDETEFIILIRYTVFLQWKCSPTVDTSQTHLYFIDAKVSERSFRYFRRVALVFLYSVIQRLDAIVQGRGGERSVTYKLQTVSADIQYSPPAQIGFGTGFLRTDVRVELFGNC